MNVQNENCSYVDFSAIVITWTLMSIQYKLHGSTWPINSLFATVKIISRTYWLFSTRPELLDWFVSNKIYQCMDYYPDPIWFFDSYDIYHKFINLKKLLEGNINHYARGSKNASNLSCHKMKMSTSFMMHGVLKNISQYQTFFLDY